MKFKYKIFLKLAILFLKLASLLDDLFFGFYNLSCGEKWNAVMDYYETDLTLEEFNNKVCGHDLTYDDLYDSCREIVTEYVNSQCGGKRDE